MEAEAAPLLLKRLIVLDQEPIVKSKVDLAVPKGTVPVGYRRVGRRSMAHAEIDGDASPFVIQAFELAARPSNSLRSSGMAGKRGGVVSLSTLQRILTNPFYASLVRSPLTGKTVVGQQEPIVTKELFNRVKLNLRRRRC